MKVYGWLMFHSIDGKMQQVRGIVAAPSFAAVQRIADAAGIEKPRRDYSGETGNDAELEAALSQPGVIFVAQARFGPVSRVYKPLDA